MEISFAEVEKKSMHLAYLIWRVHNGTGSVVLAKIVFRDAVGPKLVEGSLRGFYSQRKMSEASL